MLLRQVLVGFAALFKVQIPNFIQQQPLTPPCTNELREDRWSRLDDDALHLQIAQRARLLSGEVEAVMPPTCRSAWLLIFNEGLDNEGIYTLQCRDSPIKVLAFEHAKDATEYALRLAGNGFDLATPCCWEASHITHFVDELGYELSFVPTGGWSSPPQANIYDEEAFELLDSSDRAAALEKERAGLERAAERTAELENHKNQLERILEL